MMTKTKGLGQLMGFVALALLTSAAVAATGSDDGLAAAAIDDYGAVHQALFKDDLAAAKTAAAKLATSAKGAGDIVSAAQAITNAADLAVARAAFGDASKALITALAANSGLAAGLHAFQCPMAKGYKKWVQRSDSLQNPYMGGRMPGCGSHTDMTP